MSVDILPVGINYIFEEIHTLDDLQIRLILWIQLLLFENLSVQPLANPLRNGSAVNLDGSHVDV